MEIFDRTHCGVRIVNNFLPESEHLEIKKYFDNKHDQFRQLPASLNNVIQDMAIYKMENIADQLPKLFEKYIDVRKELNIEIDNLYAICNFYKAGSKGISPHRDFSSSKNLIGIYVVLGGKYFYVASDKEKNNEIKFDTPDNSLILMRAPRTKEENDMRPYHYVNFTEEERIVIVFREESNPNKYWTV